MTSPTGCLNVGRNRVECDSHARMRLQRCETCAHMKAVDEDLYCDRMEDPCTQQRPKEGTANAEAGWYGGAVLVVTRSFGCVMWEPK